MHGHPRGINRSNSTHIDKLDRHVPSQLANCKHCELCMQFPSSIHSCHLETTDANSAVSADNVHLTNVCIIITINTKSTNIITPTKKYPIKQTPMQDNNSFGNKASFLNAFLECSSAILANNTKPISASSLLMQT